jgi:hypothetical protein
MSRQSQDMERGSGLAAPDNIGANCAHRPSLLPPCHLLPVREWKLENLPLPSPF